jgi:hypothetical protein
VVFCCRVFKKCAPNNKITLYLSSRDLVISESRVDKLYGVLLVDPSYVQDRKVKIANFENVVIWIIFCDLMFILLKGSVLRLKGLKNFQTDFSSSLDTLLIRNLEKIGVHGAKSREDNFWKLRWVLTRIFNHLPLQKIGSKFCLQTTQKCSF